MANVFLCLALLFSFQFSSCLSYKPVVIVHGVMDGPRQLSGLKAFIEQAHPGTNVTIIDLYDEWSSVLNPLWLQVDNYTKIARDIMTKNKDGIHLICYSQGGLICRGMLGFIPNHNVQNLISLSAPMMGQFGDTDYLKYLFPWIVKRRLFRVFYTSLGQRHFSIANYWNDPHHHHLYLKYSNFLAVINNDTFNPASDTYKTSFTRLKKLILIGGPDDGVITPWQSSHFAFYDRQEVVVAMVDQRVYRDDSFGLKTLAGRGALHTATVSGVKHINWHKNITVFNRYIEPWLT